MEHFRRVVAMLAPPKLGKSRPKTELIGFGASCRRCSSKSHLPLVLHYPKATSKCTCLNLKKLSSYFMEIFVQTINLKTLQESLKTSKNDFILFYFGMIKRLFIKQISVNNTPKKRHCFLLTRAINKLKI